MNKNLGDLRFLQLIKDINGWKGLVEQYLGDYKLLQELANAYKRKGDIDFEINEWKGVTERYPDESELFRWLVVVNGHDNLSIDEWIKLARHHESRLFWKRIMRQEVEWIMLAQHSSSTMDFFSFDCRTI